MEQTWRWFGPRDPISLAHVRQAGATGIVTALHERRAGEVWSLDEIKARKALIEGDGALGLRWSVVESVPVAEEIKIGEGDLSPFFDAYRGSLRNLAAAGLRTVCYNFMPVLDWTRTDLASPVVGGGRALRFDAVAFAAFDCFLLARPGAEEEHGEALVARARAWFDAASEGERAKLVATVAAGLPGSFEGYDLDALRRALARYRGLGREGLRNNLARFLKAVVPAAEEYGIRLVIHPDDPPRPLMGLPRVVGSAEDVAFLLGACPSPANGLTLCAGSFGADPKNDVVAIARRFAAHIGFAHLRNVRNEPDGSFAEAAHLDGDTDMVALVEALLAEQTRRRDAGEADWRIPFRPDHGHELLDDLTRKTQPGYPAVGRLRGLAEIRGVMRAVASLRGHAL
ncbi:mannonate dehydratase [Chelatococcus sp. SYSU_G07232]|uniref:Mannonate dehydratase n=1 Tax=Chelatococcus albus TaxID=3047466 RepID=A0ABT7AM82_9HYPH|nr:mannonate dehydratase [Chelatococcus sp. SYSU_G07232]MDJ1160180.1 mannonate dehydratase [Chelatococcus sp. SYSU_G07232]